MMVGTKANTWLA